MSDEHDHIALCEARFYSTGWVLRIGTLALRWNHQKDYCALSIEWLKRSFRSYGGMTWREFRLARKQARKAKKEVTK